MVAFLAELVRWDTSPSLHSWVDAVRAVGGGFPVAAAARLVARYLDLFPAPPGVPRWYREDAPLERNRHTGRAPKRPRRASGSRSAGRTGSTNFRPTWG